MLRIRAFEDAAERLSQGGVSAFGSSLGSVALVRGPLHLSTGQEAVAAGRADEIILVNLSGRGDKDVETAAEWFALLDEGAS